MIRAKFSPGMYQIIAQIKGKLFISYECAKEERFSRTYGNLRMNLAGFSLDLLNEQISLPFYAGLEDIACFSGTLAEPSEAFIPYVQERTKVYPIGEVIEQVKIINDTVTVNEGEYQISIDMAVIIVSEKNTYIFSKGWFFAETIEIHMNRDFSEIYPIQKVQDDWQDEDLQKVEVIRTEIDL